MFASLNFYVKEERGMSEQDKHLLHLTNKVHQLTQLLEQSEKENKRLKRILAELSFDAKNWLAKLGRI